MTMAKKRPTLVFDLSYPPLAFSQFFHGSGLAKVKNYNLNVTEVRDSDLKNDFPGILNFTVGILFQKGKPHAR